MASTSKESPQRRLLELLDEDHDPFVLDHYLLERGCRPKSLELKWQVCRSATTNRKNNLTKLLKRSATYHGPNKDIFKSSVQFTKIARSLYIKFISIHHVLGLKNFGFLGMRKCNSNNSSKTNDKEEAPEMGRFSSASSTTLCNTFSESDMDKESISSPSNLENHQISTDRVMTQWRSVEENKQHSPVSVLDGIDFVQTVPVYNVRQEETSSASKTRLVKRVSDDSILSASLWELLIQSRKENAKQPGSEMLQYINTKKALQQTRQLLFDCVSEVVEHRNRMQKRKTMKKRKHVMIGPEELGKIICNNLKDWGNNSADERNISKLMKSDLISDLDEEKWGSLEGYKRAIACEIGDGLLQDMAAEIIGDMN